MKPNVSLIRVTVGMAAWLVLCTGSALRADVNGTILGTVTDPSGAVVPGVSVVLKSVSTGYTRATKTDSMGRYEFLAVPVGSGYEVMVRKAGFRQVSQSGIKLLVNQQLHVDFSLQLGEETPFRKLPV